MTRIWLFLLIGLCLGEQAGIGGGRLALGCGPAGCAPRISRTSTSYTRQRPCFDVNLSVATLYQFNSLVTSTTLSRTLTLSTQTVVQSVATVSSLTTVIASTVTSSTVSTTTLPSTTSLTTIVTTFLTRDETTIYSTSVIVSTSLSLTTTTFTSSFLTTATVAAINIGTGLADWSYYTEPCTGQVFNGTSPAVYTGGRNLTVNSLINPLFIASNERFRLYPCEDFQLDVSSIFNSFNQTNVTSAFGPDADPAYGAGLIGLFDDESGFSFYWIFTEARAYAMYSRVASWCPCAAANNQTSGCGPRACRLQDIEDDQRYPRPSTTSTTTGVNPCLCTACTFTTPTTSTTTVSTFAKNAPSSGGYEKFGFDYFSFTYLIPLVSFPLRASRPQRRRASISLNVGQPSVTWFMAGQALLTIKNPGTRIDPRFMLAQYGSGTFDYPDMPRQVQMAAGLMAVTESTSGRSACQGLFQECRGGQTIHDAFNTFCERAPIQQAGTYNASLTMIIYSLGITRVSQEPRPCCKPN